MARRWLALVAVLVAFVLVGCPAPATPSVSGVVIDQEDLVLQIGQSASLSATVTALGGASTAVKWTSDNQVVATVGDDGVVTGASVGGAVISATSEFDGSRSDSITVSVVGIPDGVEVAVVPVEPLPGSDIGDLRVVSRLAESGLTTWVGEGRFIVQPDEVSLVAVVDVSRSFGWMAIEPAWSALTAAEVRGSAGGEGVVGPLSTAVAILFANPAFYHDDPAEASRIVGVLRVLPEVVAFSEALATYAAEERPSEHPQVLAAFSAAFHAGVDTLGDAGVDSVAAVAGTPLPAEASAVIGPLNTGIAVHRVDADNVRFSVDTARSFVEPVWSDGVQRWAGQRTTTWLGRLYEFDTGAVTRSDVENRRFDLWNAGLPVRLAAPDRRLRLDAEYSWVAEVIDPIGLSFELLRAAYYWAGGVDERGLELPEGAYESHMVTCFLGVVGEGRQNDLTFLDEWNDLNGGVSRADLARACAQNVIEGGLDALGILPLDVSGILQELVDAGDEDLLLMITALVVAVEAAVGADTWTTDEYLKLFYRFVVDAYTIAMEHAVREGGKAVTDGLLGFLNFLGRVSSAAKTGARLGTMLRVTPLERHTMIVGDPWAGGGPGDEVVVGIAPESVTLAPNAEQAFTATVTGTSDTGVTWDSSCGSISGTGGTVTYTAPAASGECSVTATSVADPTSSAIATVTVASGAVVSVSVEPSTVTLPTNGTQSFTATVTGSIDTGVMWSATCGSVSGTGNTITYTAPATSASCAVTARSSADPTKSGTADVTVGNGGGSGNEPAPPYISIEDVTLDAASGGTRRVTLDISWGESWRGPDRPTWVEAPDNWDAAWVFVKYRVSGGPWQHATLADGGHVAPSGVVVDVPDDGTGAFIYRSSSGYGTFSADGVGLQWDYVSDGVGAGASVEVQPLGIEMVYVPQGTFSVGSGGTSPGELREGGTVNVPFVVSGQSSIQMGDAPGKLTWTGADCMSCGVPVDRTHVSFPTGFGGFYVMKYELRQGQYVSFLNSLTQVQADARKYTVPSYEPLRRYSITGSTVGSYVAGLPYVPMNYVSVADGLAYTDWAGLRPMTELEFEKAARGPLGPVSDETAWGSTSITYATGRMDAGAIDERPTPSDANAAIAYYYLGGPMRAGSFAAAGDSRRDAGSGYYGALDLTGNVSECAVSVGYSVSRVFDGMHGDGSLTAEGSANVATWVESCSSRGGAWRDNPDPYSHVSERGWERGGLQRDWDGAWGWRAGRSAP
jgi:hypothetical protein